MKDRKVRILFFTILILLGILLHAFSARFVNSDFMRSMGIELFAAGLIAILITLVLQDEVFDEIKRELRAPIRIVGSNEELSFFYVERFKSARDRIDVISQAFFLTFDQVRHLLEKKICEQNVKIRILILGKNMETFRLRLMDEFEGSPDRIQDYFAKNEEYLRTSINKFTSFEREFARKHKGRNDFKGSLRVKQYARIPYFAYFRVDESIYMTPYFSFGLPHQSPMLEIVDPGLFSLYEQHFETIWTRSDSVSLIDVGKF